MTEAGVALPIEELDSVAFAPFGTLVAAPAQPSDAAGPGWRWWAERAALPVANRPYAVGFLSLEPAPFQFDWAERHMRSVEMIIPGSGDCLVYVAPRDALRDPGDSLDLDCFRAFRLRAGQAVILNQGVWHGAPLAVDNPVTVLVLLAEGTGQHDTRVVRFGDTPVTIVQ